MFDSVYVKGSQMNLWHGCQRAWSQDHHYLNICFSLQNIYRCIIEKPLSIAISIFSKYMLSTSQAQFSILKIEVHIWYTFNFIENILHFMTIFILYRLVYDAWSLGGWFEAFIWYIDVYQHSINYQEGYDDIHGRIHFTSEQGAVSI